MRGLTATQVAKRMGVSVSTLSAMMNENPTLSSLERITEALRCDVAELFDRPVAWVSNNKTKLKTKRKEQLT